MIFKIGARRDIVGYRIDVQVAAGTEETIASVSTSYENFSIGDDSLSPSEVEYQRTFTQVGGYTPGVVRTVVVTAANDSGKRQTASKRWQD